MYMVDEESDRSPDDSPAPFQQDGLYHTAHVVKDFQHEVNIFDIAIKYYILILTAQLLKFQLLPGRKELNI